MYFSPPMISRRPVRPVLTDARAKAILAGARVILDDAGIPVEGIRIGWKTTAQGTTGAIFANPITKARFLVVVDFANGRPRVLARIG